ncbi:MAG: hypothetical protein Q9184_006831 [Pyrenodesmia sp. 2 TL-2023]
MTDTSQTSPLHALRGPQTAQTRDPFSASGQPNSDEPQTFMPDRIQPVYFSATTFSSELPQQQSEHSQTYSAWCRFGDARRFMAQSGSGEGLGPYQSHNASPHGTVMGVAGDDEMIEDSQEEHPRPSLVRPTHTRGTSKGRDQLASEKPLPHLPNASLEDEGPSTSPTDSTISARKDSDRASTSSNNTTLATSAGTSPILLGMPPTFHAKACPQFSKPPETSKCLSCDTEFTGSFQDRRSNLKRHVKYKHGKQEKVRCPYEGCNKVYLRPDNLLKHRRAEHEHTQPLKRSNAHKVIRDS